jgi:hypothetical protein
MIGGQDAGPHLSFQNLEERNDHEIERELFCSDP